MSYYVNIFLSFVLIKTQHHLEKSHCNRYMIYSSYAVLQHYTKDLTYNDDDNTNIEKRFRIEVENKVYTEKLGAAQHCCFNLVIKITE